jgi:HK97 gp10 family phage protein
MEIAIDTRNLKKLTDFFDSLSREDQTKVWMTAYRKAAKPLLAAARANVPEGRSGMRRGRPHAGGQVKRSLGMVEEPDKIAVNIGARLTGSPSNRGWAAHFTESGTKVRRTKKGANRGSTSAKWWMKSAWDQTEEEVNNNIHKEWENEIYRRIDNVNSSMR